MRTELYIHSDYHLSTAAVCVDTAIRGETTTLSGLLRAALADRGDFLFRNCILLSSPDQWLCYSSLVLVSDIGVSAVHAARSFGRRIRLQLVIVRANLNPSFLTPRIGRVRPPIVLPQPGGFSMRFLFCRLTA
jgi:hypothetical protein